MKKILLPLIFVLSTSGCNNSKPSSENEAEIANDQSLFPISYPNCNEEQVKFVEDNYTSDTTICIHTRNLSADEIRSFIVATLSDETQTLCIYTGGATFNFCRVNK